MIKRIILTLMFLSFGSAYAMQVGNVTGSVHEMEQVLYDSGELTACTNLTISGLDGHRDKEYKIYAKINGGSASNHSHYLRFNGDSGSNYGEQNINGDGSGKYAARNTWDKMYFLGSNMTESGSVFYEGTFSFVENLSVTGITTTMDVADGTKVDYILKAGWVWNSTANVTSMVISSTVANGIGAGSRFIITRKVDLTSEPFTRYGALDIKGSVEGAWELIYEGDIATAVTDLSITGLDGDKDVMYRLDADLTNKAAGSADYSVSFNGDKTNGNYGWQRLTGENATVLAERSSGTGMRMQSSGNNQYYWFSCSNLLYAKSGYTRVMIGDSICDINGTTIGEVNTYGCVWNNSANNVTSLTLFGSQTNSIGEGSKIRLYRLNLSERGL